MGGWVGVGVQRSSRQRSDAMLADGHGSRANTNKQAKQTGGDGAITWSSSLRYE